MIQLLVVGESTCIFPDLESPENKVCQGFSENGSCY